jgi:D-alanyl-D-alanine carboxypeptidase/D-alanyl-D-alanine-endopeptidase (penicillin-binding protein 4)
MKRSMNFYGETLVKTIAFEKAGIGSTDKGIALSKISGRREASIPLHCTMLDGSGLSPQNRVTVDALVKFYNMQRAAPGSITTTMHCPCTTT